MADQQGIARDIGKYDALADGVAPMEREGIEASSPEEARKKAQDELDAAGLGEPLEQVVAVVDEGTGEVTEFSEPDGDEAREFKANTE